MKRLIALGLLLAALSVTWAGPAAAGDVRCLMDNLPVEKRAQVEALYARSVEEGLASSLYSDADFDTMLAACKVRVSDDTALTAAARALAGYEAETGVAIWLKANRDIDDRTLQAVWAASRVSQPGVAEAAADDDDLAAALAMDIAARLGLEDQADLTVLAAYVSARVLRQVNESRF